MAVHGHLRVALAITQLLSTMGVMAAGGIGAGIAEEQRAIASGQAGLARADHQFQAALAASLADGTPSPTLVGTAREEWQVLRSSRPSSFILDRLVLADLQARTTRVAALEGRIGVAEAAAEEDLSRQLGAALDALAGNLTAASSAGVPGVGDMSRRVAAYQLWTTEIVIPREAVDRLQQVALLDGAVRSAISAKVAADQAAAAAAAAAAAQAAEAAAQAAAALQAAGSDAAYQRGRAHRALGQAESIPVLRVAGFAAAIAALDGQEAPQTAAGFESLAWAYSAQAQALEDLLYIRTTTYEQLSAARATAGRAAAMGIDVSAYLARLAAANAQLDSAGDVPSILAAADAIRNVSTALDGAISYARAHPPPPPGSVVLNVPFFAQVYSLSCEEASLEMALGYEGINASQDTILSTIGVDQRAPQVDGNGNVVHWGDPYTNFVGDPNGYREGAQYGSRSGYGTYDTAIARAATALGGHVLRSDEHIPPADLYAAINQHHPSVVWVAWEYSPHATTTYQAWDGRIVMHGAPWEHAVALIGTSPGSVLINNPHGGQQWITKGTFEAAYAMFDDMAVILN
jgi:uncharacterized protein YvpB